jgi:hypothetical protein
VLRDGDLEAAMESFGTSLGAIGDDSTAREPARAPVSTESVGAQRFIAARTAQSATIFTID